MSGLLKTANPGDVFGRLTVVSFIHGSRPRRMECVCSCGAKKNPTIYALLDGKTQSCGCLAKERQRAGGKKNRVHGFSGSPTMSCWSNMMKRCYNPAMQNYKYYGGAGRRVCEKLRNGIIDFIEIAGERPGDLQIDRADNTGHYSCGQCEECKREGWPMNLRWSTRKVQCRNRKNTVLLKVGEETKPIGEWAEERGLPDWKIYNDAIAGKLGELIGSKNRDCVVL